MVTPVPKITVIIAVRNGAPTLQRALDSIIGQTHRSVEIVVMDGASTDGTPAILERNSADIAYWESEPDRGIFHAWNKALDRATGDWISFLGADDRYHDATVLARVADVLAVDEGRHRVAYGYLEKARLDGSIVRSTVGPWTPAQRKRFRRGVMIPHPATFHHRSLFELHGRFDETFRIAGDYEFLLRELLVDDALFIPELVADMAGGGLSDRPGNVYTVQREVYRARYMHGVVRTPPWRSGMLLRRLTKIWLGRTIGRRFATMVGDGYRVVARKPRRRRS